MSRAPDVVVVGAGVAGVSAALAARRSGATVLVVGSRPGMSALAGGAWDIATELGLGELPAPPVTATLEVELDRYVERRPHHPYRRLRASAGHCRDLLSAIVEAHRLLFAEVPAYGALAPETVGPLIALERGHVRRPTAAQAPVLDLDSVEKRLHIVSFHVAGSGADRAYAESLRGSWGHGSFRAEMEPRSAPFDKEVVVASDSLPVEPRVYDTLGLYTWAHRLDQDEASIAELARAVRSVCDLRSGDAVLVPPVLGLARPDVRERLEHMLEVRVGERADALGSVQSLRLAGWLERALERVGCGRELGSAVRVRKEREGGAAMVELTSGDRVTAGALVLATGSFIGGGLRLDRGTIVESLVGLPIHVDGRIMPLPSSIRGPDPIELFGRDPGESAPGFRSGVGYDELLRPLDLRGGVHSSRLFAAGALLDGFDPARDGSGNGCAATTGYLAGTHAAREAGRV